MESKLVGVSANFFDHLSKQNRVSIDLAQYRAGNFFLAGSDSDISLDNVDITVKSPWNAQPLTFHINGTIPLEFINVGVQPLPYIYMDPVALDAIGDPVIREAHIVLNNDADYDEVVSSVKDIVSDKSGIIMTDRLSIKTSFVNTLNAIKLVGNFSAWLLIVIGVICIMNTMVFIIHNRRYELAVMRSIGMTNKQGRKMTLIEGIRYAWICLGIVLPLGSIANLVIYQLFREEAEYVSLSIPLASLCLVVGAVICFFISIPLLVFRSYYKQSLSYLLRFE
jgi:putative ABC transport system permease protein